MARDDDVLEFLGRLADSFCTTDHDGGDVVIRVALVAGGLEVGGLEVGVHDIEGPPADMLLGTVAPDDWVALGVAAGGWARPLDPAPGDREQRRRSTSVVLVHRSGEVVGRLRIGDDEVVCEPPAYGLTLDCLQRALGLGSAPPLHSTGVLFAMKWLEDVVVAAGDRSRPLTWADARTLHPALQVLGGDAGEPPADLVVAAALLEQVCDWERLRTIAMRGLDPAAVLTPAEAAWCDAGAFSRWVMDRRPSLDFLLSEVKRSAGSGVARRCAAVLHRLGVLSRAAA